MTEGELLTWHCKPGDVIKAGDVVCEVATDKIDMEVEATAAGTVVSLHGNPGDVIEVGVPLVAPAIANAITRATGKRPRSMPFLA